MKKKLIASLLTTIMLLAALPIGANAEWIQNSDSSWSWKENGFSSYGWKQIDGLWYYFNIGKMQTGWFNTGSQWYYFGNDGAMKTGWLNINGTSYYIKDNGALAADTVIDGIYFDSNGVVQPKEKQKVLLDNKYVKITYLGVDKAGKYSKKVEVQVDNKSGKDLIVQTDDVSIDGFMVYGMFSPTITSGKSIISGIEFNNSSIKTNFDSIDGKFKIVDPQNFTTFEDDKFSIKF